MKQEYLFYLFILLSVVTIAVFAQVALSTRRPHEVDAATTNRLRTRFFLLFAGLLVLFLLLTLPMLPYAKEQPRPDQVVYVAAKQYAFLIADAPVTKEQADGEDFVSLPEIQAGKLVEFRVTSVDVTHGFGIYDSTGRLLTQTQAMPGYVNRLRYRFEKPGEYTVLCIELCGMAHHSMRGNFKVNADTSQTASRFQP